MTTFSPLIVEDDADAVLLLQCFMTRLPFFNKPDVATTGLGALNALHQKTYDLVFLDMHLPDMDGGALLTSLPKHPPVIVTTVSPDYAADCYDWNVADYLVKPFEFSRFLRAVNRALGEVKITTNILSNKNSIYLKIGRKVQAFAYEGIDYVEAYGIYCKIWCNHHPTVVNESLATLTERLPSKYFVRIHKSYLINTEKITAYDHRQIEIAKVKLPIGISYKPHLTGLMELLNKK